MHTYLIYQKTSTSSAPEETIYIRDGFRIWAMLFGVGWCLYNRLWLVSILMTLAVYGLNFLQNHEVLLWQGKAVIIFLLSLYLGLEGSTLLRYSLKRKGYKLASIVVARSLEEAEYKFLGNILPMDAIKNK